MGKIQILNISSCIWLQRKAAVMVSAQNSILICFLEDVSCSGFEEHRFQCMSPPCPNSCFSTCSALGAKVHLTSPDSKSGGESMFPFTHELCSWGISSSCRRIKFKPPMCPEGMWNPISELLESCSCIQAPSSSSSPPPTSSGVFPSLLSQPWPCSSREKALACEDVGTPEVQCLLKLKAQHFSNMFASKALKKGRALKWGAKAWSELGQPLMEMINKHFSLGAFIASEEGIFPVFQFLHFNLVNNLFIRIEKLIAA